MRHCARWSAGIVMLATLLALATASNHRRNTVKSPVKADDKPLVQRDSTLRQSTRTVGDNMAGRSPPTVGSGKARRSPPTVSVTPSRQASGVTGRDTTAGTMSARRSQMPGTDPALDSLLAPPSVQRRRSSASAAVGRPASGTVDAGSWRVDTVRRKHTHTHSTPKPTPPSPPQPTAGSRTQSTAGGASGRSVESHGHYCIQFTNSSMPEPLAGELNLEGAPDRSAAAIFDDWRRGEGELRRRSVELRDTTFWLISRKTMFPERLEAEKLKKKLRDDFKNNFLQINSTPKIVGLVIVDREDTHRAPPVRYSSSESMESPLRRRHGSSASLMSYGRARRLSKAASAFGSDDDAPPTDSPTFFERVTTPARYSKEELNSGVAKEYRCEMLINKSATIADLCDYCQDFLASDEFIVGCDVALRRPHDGAEFAIPDDHTTPMADWIQYPGSQFVFYSHMGIDVEQDQSPATSVADESSDGEKMSMKESDFSPDSEYYDDDEYSD